jgi:apolipoprotein N-acyltransferase
MRSDMKNLSNYQLLILTALVATLANGVWFLPALSWVYPVFLMLFSRRCSVLKGALLGMPILVMGSVAQYLAMDFPGPAAIGIVIGILAGASSYIPFLIDRLTFRRLTPALAVFIYPLAETTLAWVGAVTNGSWGSIAYTQYDNLASITGIYGVNFLMGWFAAVVVTVMQEGFESTRRSVLIYATVLATVLLFGQARLNLFAPNTETVRTAALTADDDLFNLFSEDNFRESALANGEKLLERSRRAADLGAELIIWQEAGVPIHEEDEPRLIERARELARDKGIHLTISLMTVSDEFPKVFGENKIILIKPDGDLAWEYLKAKPVPIIEPSVPGDGKIHITETDLGKLAGVICYDMDWPGLIRQAGRAGVDIMLAPSNDWKPIRRLHSRMASFRAIENGFSLLRATGNGLSAGFDYQGRLLAASDSFENDHNLMFADLPKKGVTTIYARTGDVFAVMVLLALIVLLALALRNRPRAPSTIAAALLLAACSATVEQAGSGFVLPREIQGLELTEEQSGEAAAEMIGRLHGKAVAPEGSVIATFGSPPDQVVAYVSRFPSEPEAIEQVRLMGDSIGAGRSGFGHHETLPREWGQVHSVVGYGQKHYFFHVGDRVIWLSAPHSVAPGALEEFLGTAGGEGAP